MTLPPIPKDRDWSEATWRAGLDEAVRRTTVLCTDWAHFILCYGETIHAFVIAHAITLLDAGIVKPVVSEGERVWLEANSAYRTAEFACENDAAIAVIQAALDKARAVE